MELKDIRKSKDELKAEIHRNSKEIENKKRRLNIIKNNKLDFRLTVIILMALSFQMVLVLLYAIVGGIFDFSAISSVISNEALSWTLFGTSVGFGVLFEKLYNKKIGFKKELHEFSKANTNYEKLLEEMEYQIDLRKLENKNYLLQEVQDALSARIVSIENIPELNCLLKEMQDDHSISITAVVDTTEDADSLKVESREQIEKKIEEIKAELEFLLGKIDLVSYKEALLDNFPRYNDKKQKRFARFIQIALDGIMLPLCFSSYSFLLFNSVSRASMILAFVPSLLATGYIIKGNKLNDKIYNELKARLGDDTDLSAMDNGKNNDLEQAIELEILVDIICAKIICLREEERKLEKITNSDEMDVIDKSMKNDEIEISLDEDRQETVENTSVKRRVRRIQDN